ncbi:DeoR/GlpR family DNA-binding transcription regulator [uncultured Friedmanniella sp.]|uniref:DeoR/GlpR family DNA-binding transcription regulator n=1 Tax=uncultured Friedmanniella sp. TaxID=335381 RepID=UPI0035C979A9
MRAAARHGVLLSRLNRDRRIVVAESADVLGVTQETIRRDLRALEAAGRLHRVHGGAIPVDSAPPSPGFHHPSLLTAEVTEFGRRVWARLPRTGAITLGTGPLIPAVAQAAVHDPPGPPGLTVVTTSLYAANDLSRGPSSLRVYLVGGTVSPSSGGQEGQWALEELARFRVDVAVVETSGISVESGLTSDTTAAAAVNAAVVATAGRVVVVVGAEGVGHSAFVQFATLDRVDLLMVAGQPSAEGLQSLRAESILPELVVTDVLA